VPHCLKQSLLLTGAKRLLVNNGQRVACMPVPLGCYWSLFAFVWLIDMLLMSV